MLGKRIRYASVLLAASCCLAGVPTGPAPQPGGADATPLEELWSDMLHYIRIARPELAKQYAEAVLESGAAPREIYLLSVEYADSLTTIARGMRQEELKEVLGRVRRTIKEGYQAERSDPEQIAKAIEMLGGSLRAYEIAVERLKKSGEYALPQLLQKLTDPNVSQMLRERIVTVLPKLGRNAVRGLSIALKAGDPTLVMHVANALGQIEYPHALARLKEALGREDLPDRTRRSLRSAVLACGGRTALKKSTAELFYEWAEKYYYQAESISPDPRYDTALVWYWKETLGLDSKSVPRPIFCDIYAMRFARLALGHDEGFYPAVSLWLAANIKRSLDLPAGQSDPTQPPRGLTASDYVLASSPRFLHAVLGRALRDDHSGVAIKAIEGLAQTCGARSLVEPIAGGSQPLVQALTYTDRNVRFLAALSLARAQPDRPFTGYEIVMSVLNQALAQTGRKVAVGVKLDNKLKGAVRAAGFDVIETSQPKGALAAAMESPDVDVVVLGAEAEAAALLDQLRRRPMLTGLPVVIGARTSALRQLAEADGRVRLVSADVEEAEVAGALDEALRIGIGKPMDPTEARSWILKACEAIEGLGRTGNKTYDISRAEKALIELLSDESDRVRIAAADALAVLKSAEAQRAIADLASNAQASGDVRVETFEALARSLKRFGLQLTEAQPQAVLQTVVDEAQPEALRTAASKALGAMNLPSDKIKGLVLGAKGR